MDDHERTPSSDQPILYVLDTNVLIHDPNALLNFEEHHVAIPMIVLEELDKLKSGHPAYTCHTTEDSHASKKASHTTKNSIRVRARRSATPPTTTRRRAISWQTPGRRLRARKSSI